jgi:excisionase family DNA binding protein
MLKTGHLSNFLNDDGIQNEQIRRLDMDEGSQVIEPGVVMDIMAADENDVLTIAEAAELLRVHPVTLRKRAVAWGVPHKRLGSEWRFSRSVLTSWIQERDAA